MRCPNCQNEVNAKVVDGAGRGRMLQCPLCLARADEFTFANFQARWEDEFGEDEEDEDSLQRGSGT